jgi:hypothetical protein
MTSSSSSRSSRSFGWIARRQLPLLLLPFWSALSITTTRAADATIASLSFQERWFPTQVDHYNYAPVLRPAVVEPHSDTFPLRYLVDDRFFNGSSILFYSGNEAPIEQFVKNSGFMLELAAELGSMVVFAEHRYYGQSMPFGTAENSLQPGRNISYLTVEQAMQDFNLLNVHLRRSTSSSGGGQSVPIVAFGGSYGANLALWLRLKNPNLWAGAIASSATPLKHVLRETNGFCRIETEVYANVSSHCPVLVRRGWRELLDVETISDEQVRERLGLCRTPVGRDEREMLHGWIAGGLETMVQYGYPYPTEFYNPLPAYPFAEACHRMIDSQNKNDRIRTLSTTPGLDALRAAADVYYNFTGQAGPCYDLGAMAGEAVRHAMRRGRWDRMAALMRQFVVSVDNDRDDDDNKLGGGTTATSARARWRRRERLLNENGAATAADDRIVLDMMEYTDRAWGYQTCTEVYQPMPTDGVTDFEVPYVPNNTAYYEACRYWWGVEPRPDWEEMTFMGSDIGTGSNLFLSNGQLDPWRAAGIQCPPNTGGKDNDITIRTIEHGAHHYDLRPSHELDPISVRIVRQEQREAIVRWIADWNRRHPPNE